MEERTCKMRKIIIRESALRLIAEEESRTPDRFEFYRDIKDFLKQLLENPTDAKPSELLGMTRGELIDKLMEANLLRKSEKIDEPYDEDKGRNVSWYHVTFKVPRKCFKEKIRNLYDRLYRK